MEPIRTLLGVRNPTEKMEIQIDDGIPFVPDVVFECGIYYGTNEFSDGVVVRVEITKGHIAAIDYAIGNKRTHEYYRHGKWTSGTDDVPRFVVTGILT